MTQQHEVVLVTGGTGFIGRQVVKELLNQDKQIVVCGTSPNKCLPKNVDYAFCNLLDPFSVEKLFHQFRPTHCIHLAWDMKPGEYLHSVLNWQWLKASLNLMETFARQGGKRFVGGGTCYEYKPVITPRNEEITPVFPPSAYAQAKASLGQACRLAQHTLGISTLWARIFYPVGPGDSPVRLFGGACKSVAEQKPFNTRIKNQMWDIIDTRDVGTILAGLLFIEADGIINLGKGHCENVRCLLEDFFKRHNSTHLLHNAEHFDDKDEDKLNYLRGNLDVLLADTSKLEYFFPDYKFIPVRQSLEDALYALRSSDQTDR